MWYFIKKLGLALISIASVISLISLIVYRAPVDPARLQFGQRADQETMERMQKKYFLDRSYGEQVYRYFEDLSPLQWLDRNDPRLPEYSKSVLLESGKGMLIAKWPYLRRSFVTGEPVSEMIAGAIPSTLLLGLTAMLAGLFLGLFLGMLSAVNQGSWVDSALTSLTTLFYAVPSYISAILFALFFGYYLGEWLHLPIQGSITGLDDFGNEVLDLKKLILPALALGLRPIAMISQMTRASILDVSNQEYIRTAVSTGLGETRVLIRHTLPNALNPIIATISGWFASLLTGAFFVEYVFNYRGLGDLTIQALNQFDLPVVLGCCVVTVSIFILINTLADLCYSWVDPRIKIEG